MRRLLRGLVVRSGYTLIKTAALEGLRPKNGISRDHFFNLYFSTINPKEFYFVQIGANDGKTSDPIFPYITRYNLSGVVIEPQPDVFELLKKNYAAYPMVRCVNAAIAEKTGTATLYIVKKSARNEENFSRMTGIATFEKDVLRHTLKNKLPKGARVDESIEEISVPALSFADLVRQYSIERMDLLQLDCEGYDYELLKMIDLDTFAPHIMNFESMHLSKEDRASCDALLAGKGYKFFDTRSDTCAYRV